MSAPRIGWPWCGDVPSGGERRGEVTATLHDDRTITLAWDRDDATCTLVGRDVLEAIVEERNRLVRENREQEQRSELLRRQVAELEAGNDALAEDLSQQRANLEVQTKLTGQIVAERDDLAADMDVLRMDLALRDTEVEQLRIVEIASIGAHALLADAEDEVERLRGLLDRALGDLGRAQIERDDARMRARDIRDEFDSLRGDVREARAEVERLRSLLGAGARKALDLTAELDVMREGYHGAMTESGRLRGLLAEALAEAERLDVADSGRFGPGADVPNEAIVRIRREAGRA